VAQHLQAVVVYRIVQVFFTTTLTHTHVTHMVLSDGGLPSPPSSGIGVCNADSNATREATPAQWSRATQNGEVIADQTVRMGGAKERGPLPSWAGGDRVEGAHGVAW